MKVYLKYFLPLFLFAASFRMLGQDALHSQFDYAKSLYDKEDYYNAVTEFKRLLFFDSGNKFGYTANEYIGMSYKMGGKFSDAIRYFVYSEINAANFDELFTAKINIVRANILRRTTDRALDLLDSMHVQKKFSSKTGDVYYWKGWAYIFADRWGKAAESFSKTDSSRTLEELCRKVERERYSVPFAEIISHFIPGAGQFYTGHYISGLLSLGWNVLWGYFTISAFNAGRTFDGVMIANFLWLRFYNGNLQNSRKFAEEENIKISNRALNYLQYNYSGTKP